MRFKSIQFRFDSIARLTLLACVLCPTPARNASRAPGGVPSFSALRCGPKAPEYPTYYFWKRAITSLENVVAPRPEMRFLKLAAPCPSKNEAANSTGGVSCEGNRHAFFRDAGLVRHCRVRNGYQDSNLYEFRTSMWMSLESCQML